MIRVVGKSRFTLFMCAGAYAMAVGILSHFIIFQRLLAGKYVGGWQVWFMLPGSLLLLPFYPGAYHSGSGWFIGVVISNIIGHLLIVFALLYLVERIKHT